MIYLELLDGTVREVPEAESASVERGQIICRDAKGHIVLALSASKGTAYTKNEAIQQFAGSLSRSGA